MPDENVSYPTSTKEQLDTTRALNVEAKGQSVLYSGPSDKHGQSAVQDIRNRQRAEDYANREGAVTLERTDRGRTLDSKDNAIKVEAIKELGAIKAERLIGLEWKRTSRDYARQAKGDVKTYVAGAGKQDVFRAVELKELVNNSKVTTINGIPRTKLQEMYNANQKGPDRAYRAVALVGLRQDTQQAMRTGDRELIKDAIASKQIYQNQKKLDNGEKLSPETLQKQKAQADQRAERVANMRQASIRVEALKNVKAYTDYMVGKERMTAEQAKKMTMHTARISNDPSRTYAAGEKAKLRLDREKFMDNKIDMKAVNKYATEKERFQTDMRAERQKNARTWAPENALNRQTGRQNTVAGVLAHANLRHYVRQGSIKPENVPQEKARLDQILRSQNTERARKARGQDQSARQDRTAVRARPVIARRAGR